jgi:hypothetical protein
MIEVEESDSKDDRVQVQVSVPEKSEAWAQADPPMVFGFRRPDER